MNDLQKLRSQYPRVSDIIGRQNEAEMRAIPIDYLANAAIRGTKIHKYCTQYIQGLFVCDIEAEYQPYVDAFVEWTSEHVKRPILCATRLYDDVKRFTGEFDMILELKNGKRALIDVKTTATSSKTWPVQLAAYDHLCRLNGIEYDEVFILHLKKKSKKKKEGENLVNSPLEVNAACLVPEDLNASWDIFTNALHCFDYFHRKEPKE